MKKITFSKIIGSTGVFNDGDWVESKDQDPNGEVRLIQLADIGDGIFIDKSNRFLTSEKAKQLKCTYLKEGDVLVARMPDPLGRACIFPKLDKPCVTVVDVCIIRPDSKIANNAYVKFLINSPDFRNKINRFASGTTRQRISRKNLDKISFSLPDYDTQLHIANILSKAESLIAQRKESIRLLDKYLKSVFLEMFGDPVRNEKGWGNVVLAEICKKIGSGSTPKGGKESYHKEGISLIRSLNVHNDEFVFKDLAFIDENQAHDLRNVIIEENDVLLNITGASVARCCIVPKEILPARVNQHVSILRPENEVLSPRFLSRMFTSEIYQQKLVTDAKSKGATREAITKEELEQMSVIAPPLKLQNQFTQIVEKTEALKAQYQQSLQELENLYGSLSQKAFKGELTVKNESLLMAAEPETKYYTLTPDLKEKDCSQPERAILSAYILNFFAKQEIGRVHLMKLLHLTEYHCQINIHSHFVQEAAGPYDYELINDIEQYFIKYKLYRVIQDKTEKRKVHYTPVSPDSVISELFYDNFGDEALRINQLLEKFRNWSMVDCEVASTLYAVWNNRILRRQSVDYSALKQDFLKWSPRKKSIINKFDSIYYWMLENNVIPGGYGEIILKVA